MVTFNLGNGMVIKTDDEDEIERIFEAMMKRDPLLEQELSDALAIHRIRERVSNGEQINWYDDDEDVTAFHRHLDRLAEDEGEKRRTESEYAELWEDLDDYLNG